MNPEIVKKYPIWKMLMDYSIAFFAVILLLPLFFLLVIIASIDTGFPGIFVQKRIGFEWGNF